MPSKSKYDAFACKCLGRPFHKQDLDIKMASVTTHQQNALRLQMDLFTHSWDNWLAQWQLWLTSSGTLAYKNQRRCCFFAGRFLTMLAGRFLTTLGWEVFTGFPRFWSLSKPQKHHECFLVVTLMWHEMNCNSVATSIGEESPEHHLKRLRRGDDPSRAVLQSQRTWAWRSRCQSHLKGTRKKKCLYK